MNKYINTFDNLLQFNDVDIQDPSVSYIKSEDRLVVKGAYHAPTEDKTKAKVGDLVFFNDTIHTDDIEGDQPLYMDPRDPSIFMMMENDTCLGVVVITSDKSGDGTVRVVSLDYMDYNNPGSGSKTPVNMYWGKYGDTVTDMSTSDLILAYASGTTTVSLVNYSYFATDFSLIDSYKSQEDKTCSYDYNAGDNSIVPTPYSSTGELNTIYISNEDSILSNGFDGPDNTNAAISFSNVNVDSFGNNQNDYPAFACCKRYYNSSVSNYADSGSYYLPSIAELGMLAARIEEINFARTSVGYPILMNICLWSSSLCSSRDAWGLYLYLGGDFVYCNGNTKVDINSVLAFVAL